VNPVPDDARSAPAVPVAPAGGRVRGRAVPSDAARGRAAGTAALRAALAVSRASFDIRVELALEPGERLALLGPNGAGKSTVLGALAGTVVPEEASITLTRRGVERVLDAPGRRPVPVHRRGVTLVEQRPLLFPHLELRANVAFGPRSRGASRREASALAEAWLGRVGLADRAGQRPHRLSGGQQQRVALARAFAAAPDVLLLDEPFAALDAESTPAVRGLLARELDRSGTTALLVTHRLSDAWQLADRCAVLVEGHIVEHATPTELATTPRSRFGAVLAGFAVLDGVAERGGLRVGRAWLPAVPDPARPPAEGAPALGIVAPGEVEVVAAPEQGRPVTDGVVPAVVETVELRGGLVRIGAGGGLAAEVPPHLVEAVAPGGGPRAGRTLLFRPRGLRLVDA